MFVQIGGEARADLCLRVLNLLIYVINIVKFYRRGHVPCRKLGSESPDSDFRICPPLYLTYAVSNYNEYRYVIVAGHPPM